MIDDFIEKDTNDKTVMSNLIGHSEVIDFTGFHLSPE